MNDFASGSPEARDTTGLPGSGAELQRSEPPYIIRALMLQMRSRRYGPAVMCLLVAAVCATSAPAQAAAAAPPPDSPMPTVTVELNAAFVGQRIDFDVPIVVTGAISKDVTSVTLAVLRLDGRKRPKKGQPAPPPCTGKTGRTPLTEVSWTSLAGSDATAFSLVLPPLDPNIDLCFEFSVIRGLGPEEKKILTDAALRATRSAFEDLGENSALGVAKADALRRAIGTAVIDGVSVESRGMGLIQ